ncbi:hypothetical protein PC116_g26468 [Phytophthora cactorum]|nr:hypothetical protein PC116_g26468 [Phytophthora cactorum]
MAAQPEVNVNCDVEMEANEETRTAPGPTTPPINTGNNNKQRKRRQTGTNEYEETIEALFKRLIDMVNESNKEEANEMKKQIIETTNKEMTRRARDATGPNTKRRCAESTALEDIKHEMKKMKEELLNKMGSSRDTRGTGTAPKSWAEVAATPATQWNNNVAVSGRRLREITIRGNSNSPDIANRTPEETVKAVNLALGKQEAIAARRLKSGGVTVTFREGADTYKEDGKQWIKKAFGEQATGAGKAFTLVAKSLKADKLRDAHANPERLLKEIRDENKQDIESLKPIYRKDKEAKYAIMIIRTTSLDTARYLCANGLLWRAELYQCEPFTRDARAEQCYKCYRFGHMAKYCEEQARCSRCAGVAHEDGEERCTARVRCRNCGGPHPAWSKECRHVQEAKEKAKEAYIHRPRQFEEREGTGFFPAAAHATYDGFKIVAPRNRTRARGRVQEEAQNKTPAKGRPRKSVSIADTPKISEIFSSLPATFRASSAPAANTDRRDNGQNTQLRSTQ